MGVRLVCHFARAGLDVAVVDPSTSSIDKARAELEEAGLGTSGPTTVCILFASRVSDLPDDWRHIDLAIEATPEKIGIKHAVLAELESWLPDDTLIASNTSGMTTAQLAQGMRCPERLAIAHFFNPADVIPVVEIVGYKTFPDARLQDLASLLRRSGKIPAILRKETPGFVANRIQHAMMREAFHLVEEGVADTEVIDAIVRWALGVRLAFSGPFLQRDLNGLDTHLSIASYLYPDLSATSTPAQALSDLVSAGKTGRKAGEGFYCWDASRVASAQITEKDLEAFIAMQIVKEPTQHE